LPRKQRKNLGGYFIWPHSVCPVTEIRLWLTHIEAPPKLPHLTIRAHVQATGSSVVIVITYSMNIFIHQESGGNRKRKKENT